MRSRKVKSHKEEHHSLINYLIRTGIQPSKFAFFLNEFIKKQPPKKTSVMLNDILKAQAELILFNLKTHALAPLLFFLLQ